MATNHLMTERASNAPLRDWTPRALRLTPVVLLIAVVSMTACSKSDDVAQLASVSTTSSLPVAQEAAATASTTSVPAAAAASEPTTTLAPVAPPPTRRQLTARPPTAPVGDGPREEVKGAPLRIPAITNLQGQAIATVMPIIISRISEACETPTPCVTIKTVERDEGEFFTVCQFVAAEPGEGTLVERHSTVTVVVGDKPAKKGLPCSVDENE